ncbi:hypothetical protein HOC80_04860 [archaeon]|jgi:potassium/hydrogen antiporter|nr:hypothetical protein [archaeon]MBT4417404.1 hypothetical protein [archaeon]
MALDYIASLSWLSLLLLLGVLISIIAKRFNLPQILLLILVGVGFGFFGWFTFDAEFLTGFGLFALIMIIFDATSKFKLKEVAEFYPVALKLTGLFIVINGFILSLATQVVLVGFSIEGILFSILFGFMMAGTSPSTMLSMLEGKREKVAKILEFESILNTPFIIIIPLMILYYLSGDLVTSDLALYLFRGVMAGIGTGLVLGFVAFRLMKKEYMENISPLVVVAMALVSFTLAEYIGGNGVLSVTTLGIVYSVSVVKEKETMGKFVDLFTSFLTIVIFILLGMVIAVPSSWLFLAKSLGLFMVYLAVRYLVICLALKQEKLVFKEKLFMTLSVSKGIGEAVIALVIIATMGDLGDVTYLGEIIKMVFLFIFYSIVLSSFVVRFTDFFLNDKNRSSGNRKRD